MWYLRLVLCLLLALDALGVVVLSVVLGIVGVADVVGRGGLV